MPALIVHLWFYIYRRPTITRLVWIVWNVQAKTVCMPYLPFAIILEGAVSQRDWKYLFMMQTQARQMRISWARYFRLLKRMLPDALHTNVFLNVQPLTKLSPT